MKPSALRARSGFTLVEVLLVLMIMSAILVTIAQVLTAARTSRDTIHNIRETQLAGPAILDLIERDLLGLWTFNVDPALVLRVQDRVVAGLDADRIDFVSTTDGLVLTPGTSSFLRADVNEVGYCLRPNPDNNDFLELFRRQGFGIDEEPFSGGDYTFLHDRIVGFDVRVYEEDGLDVEEYGSWGTEYDESSGLPARIEIDLSLELAPRLLREQLSIAPIHQRTVTHRRVIRFPEVLRRAERLSPVAMVPAVAPPTLQTGAGEAGGATTVTVTSDDEDGVQPLQFPGTGEGGGGGGEGTFLDVGGN